MTPKPVRPIAEVQGIDGDQLVVGVDYDTVTVSIAGKAVRLDPADATLLQFFLSASIQIAKDERH